MRKLMSNYGVWLMVAVATTFISGLVCFVLQQQQRQYANDPQIQMAEDAASALSQSQQPFQFDADHRINILQSQQPFMTVYNAAGEPISGTGELNGKLPSLPKGVLAWVKSYGTDKITWEPLSGARYALVVAPFKGQATGFVAAARSLRDIEARENFVFWTVFAFWLLTLLITFLIQWRINKAKV